MPDKYYDLSSFPLTEAEVEVEVSEVDVGDYSFRIIGIPDYPKDRISLLSKEDTQALFRAFGVSEQDLGLKKAKVFTVTRAQMRAAEEAVYKRIFTILSPEGSSDD